MDASPLLADSNCSGFWASMQLLVTTTTTTTIIIITLCSKNFHSVVGNVPFLQCTGDECNAGVSWPSDASSD